MPFKTIPNTDIEYALIAFDKHGNESTLDPDGMDGVFSRTLLTKLRQDPPSHIFFFSHGWKGDVPAAVDQYNRWIKAVVEISKRRTPSDFKPLWIGLHWPSLPWGDEELGGDSFSAEGATDAPSPDELLNIYLDRLALGAEAEPLLRTIIQANSRDAAAAVLPREVAAAYTQLATLLGHKGDGPGAPPDADGLAFDPDKAFEAGNQAAAASFGGGGGGGILDPLRQLSFWTMKKRARSIGEGGLHDFMKATMQAAPQARVHMMGHSFGCIVTASILGGQKGRDPLPRQVDSVVLVQGAVSHWSFADDVPDTSDVGYYNALMGKNGARAAVRGPIVVTRSTFDRAVGTLYPVAMAAAVFSNASFAAGAPEDDRDLPVYGAIGAFGIRGLPGIVNREMLPETDAYNFEAGKLYNLESSRFIRNGGGLSGAHSDIDGPQVAHAIWEAVKV
jgi:hypothetical protein